MMSNNAEKLAAGAPPGANPELDVFEREPVQGQVSKGEWVIQTATDYSSEASNVRFSIPADRNKFTDINETLIELDVKITKEDGTALDDNDGNVDVAAEDNFAHCLFRKGELKINGTSAQFINEYAHQAYLKNLLFTTKEVKETSLKCEGWSGDSSVGRDGGRTAAADFTARKTPYLSSATQTITLRPSFDLVDAEKMLPPDTTIEFEFTKASSNVCLRSANNNKANGGGKVVILAARIRIRRATLRPDVHTAIISTWDGVNPSSKTKGRPNPMVYQYHQHNTERRTIATGATSAQITATQIKRPDKVFTVLVRDEAINGSPSLNPFCFAHNSVKRVSCRFDGTPVREDFITDFATSNVLAAYRGTLDACGLKAHQGSNGITPHTFSDGSTVFGWDLTSTLSERLEPGTEGTLTIEFTFATATTHTLSCFVYTISNGVIEIFRHQKPIII